MKNEQIFVVIIIISSYYYYSDYFPIVYCFNFGPGFVVAFCFLLFAVRFLLSGNLLIKTTQGKTQLVVDVRVSARVPVCCYFRVLSIFSFQFI